MFYFRSCLPKKTMTACLGIIRSLLTRTGYYGGSKHLDNCRTFAGVCNVEFRSTNTSIEPHCRKLFKVQDWRGAPQCRTYAKKLTFKYSNDLARRSKLDKESLVYNYKGLAETIQQAPDVVHRLSSLEYADGKQLKYHRLEEMHERIEHLFGSNARLEQRIAKLTVEIRSLIPHCLKFKQNKYHKSRLVEKIQMRKKLLKFLRRDDYEHFIWLLRELRIRYIPTPEYHGRLTKKYLKRAATKQAARDLRLAKLAELEKQLEEERVEFEKHKEEVLVQIEKDIEQLNLDPRLLDSQGQKEDIHRT